MGRTSSEISTNGYFSSVLSVVPLISICGRFIRRRIPRITGSESEEATARGPRSPSVSSACGGSSGKSGWKPPILEVGCRILADISGLASALPNGQSESGILPERTSISPPVPEESTEMDRETEG